MSIVIDNPELERQLRALAAERGESVEDVLLRITRGSVTSDRALHPAGTDRERKQRLAAAQQIIDRIHAEIGHDTRSPDDIIGYDDDGLAS